MAPPWPSGATAGFACRAEQDVIATPPSGQVRLVPLVSADASMKIRVTFAAGGALASTHAMYAADASPAAAIPGAMAGDSSLLVAVETGNPSAVDGLGNHFNVPSENTY